MKTKILSILRALIQALTKKYTSTMGEFIPTAEALEMTGRHKLNNPDKKEGVEFDSDFLIDVASRGEKVQVLFAEYEDGTATVVLKPVGSTVFAARGGDDDGDDDGGGEYANRGGAIPPPSDPED